MIVLIELLVFVLIMSSKQKENSRKPIKTFLAQVVCPCNRKCPSKIDVLQQAEIFNEYTKLKSWTSQTRYLRSLITKKPAKENLNPIIQLNEKENFYNYHLINEDGLLTEVCSSFLSNVLQITRKKVLRAVSSMEKNPKAIELRGSGKKHKTDQFEMKFLCEFSKNSLHMNLCANQI